MGEDTSTVIYYLHHAGGLPIAPQPLKRALSLTSGAEIELKALPCEGSVAGDDASIEGLAAAAERGIRSDRARGRRPWGLYGHSMGALVAFEIARNLHGMPQEHLPRAVLLAAALPPGAPRLTRAVSGAGGAGGAAGESFASLDAGEAGQRLRRGLARCACYAPPPSGPPAVPIHLVCGRSDSFADVSGMQGWGEILGTVRIHFVPGSHLFHLSDDVAELAAVIAGAMTGSQRPRVAAATGSRW